jgi:thiosulfate reductase cytochrome b subunit
MLLNSSLIGYFSELNLENKITGVSSPEYIFSEKIHQLIKKIKFKISETNRNMILKKSFPINRMLFLPIMFPILPILMIS